jgi:hypothetical protein
MNTILTVTQIESQFNAEWVLLVDPETDASLQIQSGKVVWHSKDRDEVHQKAIELHPKRFAVLYTGQISEDAAIVFPFEPYVSLAGHQKLVQLSHVAQVPNAFCSHLSP